MPLDALHGSLLDYRHDPSHPHDHDYLGDCLRDHGRFRRVPSSFPAYLVFLFPASYFSKV